MYDQKKMWEKIYVSLDQKKNESSKFSSEILEIIPPHSSVLELGCGTGEDAVFFAANGHNVIATDFSEEVISRNKKSFNSPSLTFQYQDITKSFPFENGIFDLVYARLSLHYFTDETTKKVFKEIRRVLKKGGMVAFLCKSTKDPLYGKGVEIEGDMYELDGHVRHFFSEEYARKCLKYGFKISKIESGKDEFYGKKSAFIKVIAIKNT